MRSWTIYPSESNAISSSADKIKDESHLNVHMLVRKPKLKTSHEEAPLVCSSDEHSKSNKRFATICLKEHFNITSTRNNEGKNCQADKSTHMQPKKPTRDMQSNRPAVPIQNKMTKKSQILPQEDGKNCLSPSLLNPCVLTTTVKKISICGQRCQK